MTYYFDKQQKIKFNNMKISKKTFPKCHSFIYELSNTEINNYINVWFNSELNNKTYSEIITVKEVDKETHWDLMQKKYNPIHIFIMLPNGNDYNYNETNELLFTMKAMINSSDDSSYGIWWKNNTYKTLDKIRTELMSYVNNTKIINGNAFLNKCIELNADETTIDYN